MKKKKKLCSFCSLKKSFVWWSSKFECDPKRFYLESERIRKKNLPPQKMNKFLITRKSNLKKSYLLDPLYIFKAKIWNFLQFSNDWKETFKKYEPFFHYHDRWHFYQSTADLFILPLLKNMSLIYFVVFCFFISLPIERLVTVSVEEVFVTIENFHFFLSQANHVRWIEWALLHHQCSMASTAPVTSPAFHKCTRILRT